MYNSEEVYTFEQNRQTESQPASNDQHKNGRLNNSRPKNGLLVGQKGVGILGTYARIVPKKPLHDMERLYAENMQLREKIKFLEEDCTKIKTRMSMAQKQKQQLVSQLTQVDFGNNVLRDRRPSQKGLVKTQEKTTKSVAFDENRRILHGYKDEISKLKVQNGRLKKTVKYTQIQQLETENQLLHEEMARLKKYIQDVIENTEYDEYERQIQVLNKQLQEEKESKKSIMMQIKKKDQEMEDVKNKMKIIANRKTQLEKKFNREITNVRGELHRAKQKQKEFILNNNDKRQTSKLKNAQRPAECKKCTGLQSQRSKTKELQIKLNAKQKQVADLQRKLKQLEGKVSKNHQSPPPKNHVKHEQPSTTKVQSKLPAKQQAKKQIEHKQKAAHKSPKKNEQQKSKKPLQPEQQHKKDQSYHDDDYDEDSDEDLNQQSDQVDVFHVNLNNDKQNSSHHETKKLKTEEKYEESFQQSTQKNKKKGKFEQNQSQEEVLFKKQDNNEKPKKKKNQHTQSRQKTKEKEKPRQKQKEKQVQKGSTKAQKILKQTIKYRLMAQRYSYPDFHRDIKQSGAKQFTIQQLIQMLTNEPFFLTQEHLKMVLFGIFEKEQLDETDIASTSVFLKKMKQFIGQFQIRDEGEEQKLLKSIQNKLGKKKILSKMQQEAINDAEISKKNFVKILKQSAGLNEAQIEQCLAEASVLSVDIAHINYPQFLQKLGHS